MGATLPGLAAAARLARVNHEVVVVDRQPSQPDLLPSPLEDAITLPAAWRDLFRKTGRPLDAVLTMRGVSLTPAPTRTLSDGVRLPADRAGQWHTLVAAYSVPAATAWRQVLDEADTAWLTLRRLGVEAEFNGTLDAAARRALGASTSLEHLAGRIPVPPLATLIRDLAGRRDSDPRRTPAWLASRLSIERTFGQWQLAAPSGEPHPARLLAELLAERLALRGVEVRFGCTVRRVGAGLVSTDSGDLASDATIVSCDPWQAADLTGRRPPRLTRAATSGPQWRGWRTLQRLPPLRTRIPGVYEASAFSPAGPEPWAQLLTGALAAYRVHHELTGEDMRPTNKAYRPPPPRGLRPAR
ncbi:MAG: hypothetical protein WCF12_09390 [Propionicimonas sp.]